jgi:UDP-3-O-[3-hydroxymyristoyl] glucosamine N-acyltransferase
VLRTLKAIAEAVGGELTGDPELLIGRVRAPEEAGEGEIAVLADPRRSPVPKRASAVLLAKGVELPDLPPNLVRVGNPRAALVILLGLFHPGKARPCGAAVGSFVSEEAVVDPAAFVAAGATVEAGARIGPRCEVHAGAYVGEEVVLGDDCVLYPNVTLYAGTVVGSRVTIHAGTVVGSDGFGYDRDAAGVQVKIPQVGRVVIGDDVEIGANCAIDRATLETTWIGRGTKIDNLVQIGHNTRIGEDCCLVGQAGVAGSVTLGRFCVLAGQAGIADHVVLGNGVVVGAQCGVPHDLKSGIWLGTPALPRAEAGRVYLTLPRLPEMRREMRALEERCAKLEEALAGLGSTAGEKS